MSGQSPDEGLTGALKDPWVIFALAFAAFSLVLGLIELLRTLAR